MPKYQKKSVTISAFVVDNSNVYISGPLNDLPWWAEEEIEKGNILRSLPHNKHPQIKIKTLEGEMVADVGDYIIQGEEGEIYPCKPDIFEKTYTLADGD